MFKKSKATRQQVKLMVGVSGPSGSGKTWGALQVAFGITGDWSKITVIDTENKSALYYADRPEFGPYEHIPFDPTIQDGYSPRNYIKAIDFAESDKNCEVIVIDSISHEWEGQGGCLDQIDRIAKGFAGWKVVTPLHNDFIDRMRHGRCHIIATMRTKQDYVVEQINGKSTPKKVGLKSNQREGVDYEFGIVFDVEISHFASASKDRTGMFSDRGPFKLGVDVGKQLLAWANKGEKKAEAGPPAEAKDSQKTEPPKKGGLSYDSGNAEMTAKVEKMLANSQKPVIPKSYWPQILTQLHGRPVTDLRAIVDEIMADPTIGVFES